jgi:hypothetical protein
LGLASLGVFFQMFKNWRPKALDFLLAHATNTPIFFLMMIKLLYFIMDLNTISLVGKANKCDKKCIIINLASMLLCLTKDDQLIN